VCVCLCARVRTLTFIEVTFDRDIWHDGLNGHLHVKFAGQGHRSKFSVTGGRFLSFIAAESDCKNWEN